MNSASSGWANSTSADRNSIHDRAYRLHPQVACTHRWLDTRVSERQIQEYEAAFRRAGLPNLIEDYSAAEDIFTRALPLLGLVFLLEISNALILRYAWWA